MLKASLEGFKRGFGGSKLVLGCSIFFDQRDVVSETLKPKRIGLELRLTLAFRNLKHTNKSWVPKRHSLSSPMPSNSRFLQGEFWDKGDQPGVALCAKPPAGLLDKLADMKCAEFVKAKAYLAGEDVSDLRTMSAGKQKPKIAEEQGLAWEALRQPVNDASRYDKDAERRGHVGRLLAVALAMQLPSLRTLGSGRRLTSSNLLWWASLHSKCRIARTLLVCRALSPRQRRKTSTHGWQQWAM